MDGTIHSGATRIRTSEGLNPLRLSGPLHYLSATAPRISQMIGANFGTR